MLTTNIKVTYNRLIDTLNTNSRSYNHTIHTYTDKVDGLYKYTHKYTTLSKSNMKPLWFFKHHRIRSSKTFSLVRRFNRLDDDRISHYNNLPSEEYPL